MYLKFAVENFVMDREFRNLSPKSISSYSGTLKEFQNYCSEKEIISSQDVTVQVIKSYLLYCRKERKNAPTSINHKLHNLKIFFNFLQEELELYNDKTNPTRKMKYMKTNVRIDVYTDKQIAQMLAYYRKLRQIEKSFFAVRNYTMILMLLGTGIRLGELVNLKWDNVDFINLTVTVYGKKRQDSSLPLTNKLKKELSDYKVYCEQHFGKLPENIFTTNKRTKLSENAVKCVFKRLKKIMGFHVNCHRFRHTFAHRYLMAGGDVFSLQRMLRHSSLNTTQRYVALWGTALKEQNDKFNPLNELDF